MFCDLENNYKENNHNVAVKIDVCIKERVGDTGAMRKANRDFSAAPEEGKIECGVDVIFGESNG